MEIDLATKTIGSIRRVQRAKHLFDKLIIWGAFVLSLALIIMAVLNLLVSRANVSLNQRIDTAKKQIQAQSKVESQQLYLSTKLASFGSLVKTHELHQAIANTIFSVIPNGTTLKGFEVTETGTITLAGSVPSWQLLSQLLANLRQPPSGYLPIKSSTIKQVGFNAEGGVNFTLEIVIKV